MDWLQQVLQNVIGYHVHSNNVALVMQRIRSVIRVDGERPPTMAMQATILFPYVHGFEEVHFSDFVLFNVCFLDDARNKCLLKPRICHRLEGLREVEALNRILLQLFKV